MKRPVRKVRHSFEVELELKLHEIYTCKQGHCPGCSIVIPELVEWLRANWLTRRERGGK
jgi:hypothetical protein